MITKKKEVRLPASRAHSFTSASCEIKPLIELFNPATIFDYAMLCGWTLARAHARSSDPAIIAGYMGKSNVFDKAVTRFSELYADQGELDHAALKDAVRRGRIEVRVER